MKLYEVSQREPQLICQLTTIWEDSVRATHLFLSEAEIQKIKAYVPHALTGVSHLLVAEKMGVSRLPLWGSKAIVWKCCSFPRQSGARDWEGSFWNTTFAITTCRN